MCPHSNSLSALSAAMPRGLEGAIFDCDGVLLNSLRSNTMYYNLIRRYFGLPNMSEAEEDYAHMHTSQQSIAHILPPPLLGRLREAMNGIDYMRDLVPHITPEPGIYNLLQGLQAAGVKLAVNTNRTTLAETVLDYFELSAYFSLLVTAGTHPPKPDPAGILFILDSWKVKPDAVFFVGDSVLDEQAAKGAGVPLVAYRNSKLAALAHVQHYDVFSQDLGAFLA